MNITIATMTQEDIAPISMIQSENLRANLSPEQQKEGYLSIAFSAEEFNAFNDDIGVIVAKDQEQVAGYCCVSSAEFNAEFPILNQIIPNLPTYIVPGSDQKPDVKNSCIYGPACIAKPYRGQKILPLLFTRTLEISKQSGYEFCFSFVSTENQRSLDAHLKLPLQRVGQVQFNNNDYVVIGCKI